jgi:hypothetical protein
MGASRAARIVLAMVVLALPLASGIAPAQALGLSITANGSTFRAGDTTVISVAADNSHALTTSADFYFVVVPPDTSTLFFLGPGMTVGSTSVSDLSSIQPLTAGVDLTTPFTSNQGDFVSYTWQGAEPRGTYIAVLVALTPGALADDQLDLSEIVAVSSTAFAFTE